jgi:hypothetical protein
MVGVGSQKLEEFLPDAAGRPPAEARMHLLPGTKPLRQVAPGDPGAVAVQHGFDE